jgi:hypothetical protein
MQMPVPFAARTLFMLLRYDPMLAAQTAPNAAEVWS